MLKRLLSNLFGAPARPGTDTEPAVEYKGYRILASPIREGELWRVAGEISRDVEGGILRHRLVRADTLPDREQAVATTIAKARLVVDQQGERMFAPVSSAD